MSYICKSSIPHSGIKNGVFELNFLKFGLMIYKVLSISLCVCNENLLEIGTQVEDSPLRGV